MRSYGSGNIGSFRVAASSLPPEISQLALKLSGLAFLTHLTFLLIVLALSARSGSELYITPDSGTYILPADNLVRHGYFSGERAPPYLWEPYRTPGYPLLIAAALAVSGKPAAVLFFAPFFAALLAYTLVCLTWELFADRRAATFAGVAAAFFPNGLGLSATIMTDFVHGCVFVAALRATLRAIRQRNVRAAAVAAAFWIAAQLIRPTLSLACLLIAAAGLWLARDRRHIAITTFLVLTTLPVPLYLSLQNFEAHGVFAPTLLGAEALANHSIPRAEALATGKDLEELQRNAVLEDTAAAAHSPGRSVYGQRYHALQRRAARTMDRYRVYFVLQVAREAVRQTLAPWDFFVLALFGGTVAIVRACFAVIYLIFLAFAVQGSWIAARRIGPWMPAFFWFVFFFWVLTGAITIYVGSRYRFPGDLALIPLAAVGLSRLPTVVGDKK